MGEMAKWITENSKTGDAAFHGGTTTSMAKKNFAIAISRMGVLGVIAAAVKSAVSA